MHQLQFIDQGSSIEPFGFIDPDNIICEMQLIPAFVFGSTGKLLDFSKGHHKLDSALDGEDWNYYYVNMYVF